MPLPWSSSQEAKILSLEGKVSKGNHPYSHAVDGRNPAPVDR